MGTNALRPLGQFPFATVRHDRHWFEQSDVFLKSKQPQCKATNTNKADWKEKTGVIQLDLMAGKSSKCAEINASPVPQAKSLHISRKVINLYGTEIEFQASFGPVGIDNMY